MAGFYHRPVMLDEVIEGLNIRPNCTYFDGTVGGGGHSYQILTTDPTVRLIATDKDDEALKAAGERLKEYEGRFQLSKSDYKSFAHVLDCANVQGLDGVLLDFGISSHQIDDESRGFSYLKANAPLDMRMDRQNPLTAEMVVNEYSEERLYQILREYGEERFASSIVKNIAKTRKNERICTCGRLAELIEQAIPAKFRYQGPCARQSFQAIRIEVNGELDGLKECVEGLAKRLNPSGRIAILTFHSLEDRIVKRVFQDMSSECDCPKSFPVCVCGKKKQLEIITRKPITACEQELRENSRSKCAKLRVAQKV